MKIVTRVAAALAALALAVPALACEGHDMKTTEQQQAKPVVATAAKKAPAPTKAAPAPAPAQQSSAKPATAQN